jgi:hypothetical protein
MIVTTTYLLATDGTRLIFGCNLKNRVPRTNSDSPCIIDANNIVKGIIVIHLSILVLSYFTSFIDSARLDVILLTAISFGLMIFYEKQFHEQILYLAFIPNLIVFTLYQNSLFMESRLDLVFLMLLYPF